MALEASNQVDSQGEPAGNWWDAVTGTLGGLVDVYSAIATIDAEQTRLDADADMAEYLRIQAEQDLQRSTLGTVGDVAADVVSANPWPLVAGVGVALVGAFLIFRG